MPPRPNSRWRTYLPFSSSFRMSSRSLTELRAGRGATLRLATGAVQSTPPLGPLRQPGLHALPVPRLESPFQFAQRFLEGSQCRQDRVSIKEKDLGPEARL